MANNVYKFPGGQGTRRTLTSVPEPAPDIVPVQPVIARKALSGIIKMLWFVVALGWPFLRWVLAFDVVFQGLMMVWHWDTPNHHAGWTFVLHFAVLVALTIFVSVFKPQGVR
jgi:hypothetical protein